MIWCDDALLQRRTCNNRLERGARLIDKGYGTVLPILLWIVPETIRVVRWTRCHREDLPGLRIHDDRRDGGRIVLRHCTVKLLLYHELNRAVDRQHRCLAVVATIGTPPEKDGVEDRPPLPVDGQALLAHLTLEQRIECLLHAVEPFIVRADEAKQVCGERIVRIVALRLVLKAETVAVALLTDDGANRLVLTVFKSPLDPDKAAADSDIIEDLPLREPEERSNIGSDLRRIVRLVDVVWVDKEGFRHIADGEFLAVAVKDCTAQGLDAELIAALVAHALCECITLNHLQIGIAKRQDNECGKHE